MPRQSRRWLGPASLLGLALFAVAPAAADVDLNDACVDTGAVIRCTFLSSDLYLSTDYLEELAKQIVAASSTPGRPVADDTPAIIEAWGGYGGSGHEKHFVVPLCDSGVGGSGGYARTATTLGELKATAPDLFIYVGQRGGTGVDSEGGGGGAATLVLGQPLPFDEIPGIPDPASMQAFVIAGGGGGGGGCVKKLADSGDGGMGAVAIPTVLGDVSATGEDGSTPPDIIGTSDRGHFGEGGNGDLAGTGGSRGSRCSPSDRGTEYDGCAAGYDGVGGWGGYFFPDDSARWFDTSFDPLLGYLYGHGGDYGWPLGGGGGGGYGGGGGGGSYDTLGGQPCWQLRDGDCSPAFASGGGGGGSWARQATVSDKDYGLLGQYGQLHVNGFNGSVVVSIIVSPTFKADLQVSVDDGVAEVHPGGSLTYTLVASNQGPMDAKNVLVEDTFPDYLTCTWTSVSSGGASDNEPSGSGLISDLVNLPVSSSVTYTLDCGFASIPETAETIVNRALLGNTIPDPDPSNNTASDSTTIVRIAELSVDKEVTSGPTAVPGEDTITYQVTVDNDGPEDDPLVPFSDPFPAVLDCAWTAQAQHGALLDGEDTAQGTGPIDEALFLPVASSVTFQAQCTIDPTAPPGPLTNTATISPLSEDPSPDDHASSATVMLEPKAGLVGSLDDGVTAVEPGEDVVYTMSVTNPGPSPSSQTLIMDDFPVQADCSWTSQGTGGATGFSDGFFALNQVVSLPVGASVTYVATCEVDVGASGTLDHFFMFSAAGFDGEGVLQDSDTIVSSLADLSARVEGLEATSLPPEVPFTYQVVFENTGPDDSPGSTIDASLGGTVDCEWTATGQGGASGFSATGTGAVMETVNLPAGARITVSTTCTFGSTQPATTVDLSAAASGPVTDPVPSNNMVTVPIVVRKIPVDLAANNAAISSDPVSPGQAFEIAFDVLVADVDELPIDPTVTDSYPSSLQCTWALEPQPGVTGTMAGTGPIDETLHVEFPAGPLAMATYRLTCRLDPSATGTLTYSASIGDALVEDGDPTNDKTSASAAIAPQADLSVTLDDGAASAPAGGGVTYTLVVANAGPGTDPAAVVAAAPPADLSCSWFSVASGGASGGSTGSGNLADTLNLPPGSSVTYTLTCAVGADASGSVTLSAAVHGGVTDPSSANDSASDTDVIEPPTADLSITKTDGVTRAQPGDSVTYMIVATNQGPHLDPAVAVTDTLPSALTSCARTSVAAGGATGNTNGSGDLADALVMPAGSWVTYTIVCTIDGAASGTLANTATISGSGGDPDPTNDSATDDDTVLSPVAELSITKSDGLTAAHAGDPIAYTLVAANAGPSADTATLVDTLPGELTGCTWTAAFAGGASGNASGSGSLNESLALPAGSSVTYTVDCTIDPAATGTLVNTATITGTVGEGDEANNTATDDDTVLDPVADLTITNSDHRTTAYPGASATYFIVARNLGPDPAYGATVTDTLPAELTCTWTAAPSGGAQGATTGSGNLAEVVDLPAGAQMLYTVVCTVAADATGTLIHTASVSSAATDPEPGNDQATDTTRILTADLEVEKTAPAAATPGESVVYTVVVTNHGPDGDPGARVLDTPPGSSSCTWTAAAQGGASGALSGSAPLNQVIDLPAGASMTYSLTCPIAPTAGAALVNTASVDPLVYDPEPGNDTDTATVDLGPTADLSVTKTDHVSAADPGGSVTYAVAVANAGPSADPAARIQDPMGTGLTCSWTSQATGGASGAGSGSGSLDESVSMPAGSAVYYTITCAVDPSADGTLVNTAWVTASIPDPESANNTATDDDTAVSPEADLAITKTDGLSQIVAGSPVHYTIEVRNNGPDGDPAVRVTDSLSGALQCTWESVASGGAAGSAGAGSGSIEEALSMPAGASVVYTLTCDVDPTASGRLANSARVAGSRPDPDPTNNVATDRDTELLAPAKSPVEIPVDTPLALILLAGALGTLGWWRLSVPR